MARRRVVTAIAVAVGLGTLPVAPPAAAEAEAAARTVGATTVVTPAGELEAQTVAVEAPAPGRVVEVPIAAGTQMVGVSWALGAAAVAVATPEGDGWSAWTDLHADAPDDGDPSARTGVGPVWLGDAGVDRIALRVEEGDPVDLRVEAMSFEPEAVAPAPVATDASAAAGPTVRGRAEWAPGGWRSDIAGCGARPATMGQLTFAVVHHTAGTNSYTAADVPGILAGIYRFHTGTNGWCDIAYNLFVDRFGQVWEGRTGGLDAPILGGHARGFNSSSVGVAVIGTQTTDAPSAAALTALRDVLAWKLGSHGVSPTATIRITSGGSPRYPAGAVATLPTIQGHRDSGVTACPGEALYARLPSLRADVAARIAATNTPSTWAPEATGAAFFGRVAAEAAGRPVPNGVPGTYTSLVTRAGRGRNGLATALVLSDATDVRVGGVDRLYRAAFGREAETDGLRFWVGQRDRGMAIATMARQFSGTPEFRSAYGNLGNRAYATAIYRNVLGRAPDASGLDYWVGRLEGGTTRHQLLASFTESAELRARRQVAGEITRAFFVLLDRAPTRADRAAWTDVYGRGGRSEDMVALVLASPEYAAR